MKLKRTLALVLALLLSLASVAQAAPTIRAAMTLNLVASRGDWQAYLRGAAANGINTIRFGIDTLVGEANEYNPLTPFKLLGWWKPGDIVGHPEYPAVPCVDLTQKNPEYWSKLRDILVEMKALGLTPWVFFEDRCSISYWEDWHLFLNSFYGNSKMFPGWSTPGYYHDSVQAKYGGGILSLDLNDDRYRLEFWFIDLCYSIGLTTVYAEPMNEYGWAAAPACTIAQQLEWFKVQCAALRNLKYTIIIGSAVPPIERQIIPYVDVYDQHCVIEAGDVDRYAGGLNRAKTILNSDGAPNGQGTSMSFLGYRNRSVDQANGLGARIVAEGWAGWCDMPQEQIDTSTINGHEVGWNLDKVDWAPARALAIATCWTPPAPPVEYVTREVCTGSGLLPNAYCPTKESRKFVKGEEPTTVCAVHKAPTPPPPKKGWLAKLISWLFGWLK